MSQEVFYFQNSFNILNARKLSLILLQIQFTKIFFIAIDTSGYRENSKCKATS